MSRMNASCGILPFSISASSASQRPVISTSAMSMPLTMEYRASPFSVGTSDFFTRTMYSLLSRVSMMAARVAGVPMPQSFNACRASSSSKPSRPAVSIAASRVLSVCNGFGRVMPELIEQPLIANISPSFQSGKTVSMLSSP